MYGLENGGDGATTRYSGDLGQGDTPAIAKLLVFEHGTHPSVASFERRDGRLHLKFF